MTSDEYMTALQETALKGLDHKRLRNEEIMFRLVDTQVLSPRFRVEMGVVIGGRPVLVSTMQEKDPRVVARRLVEYVALCLDAE